MKIRDIWIIVIVLAIALISIFIMHNNSESDIQTKMVIRAANEIYDEIPLTEDTNETINVETARGLNKIKIENGVVSINEADCPDQICVHNRPIDQVGEIIVCLPNQVIVEIVSTNER
ncbi:NusG domain II-containing protein [Alkalibaculum sp. M08DMB]|uniref:NusG domain II-containing protein n=1 Tax=Alkalibaculum sporogenes TaxID=2655001 RepID=A0A6A7KC78_9FIRM|nr:NusG domain II-containing protein [Alkalibaculum sporogenes]MPW26901.1 NusG domain II-containing protein [Alkalibaculum sporogenes]